VNTYGERDAFKAIVMVSDDGGLTWYPRGGNAALAAPMSTQVSVMTTLESSDAGVTWQATP